MPLLDADQRAAKSAHVSRAFGAHGLTAPAPEWAAAGSSVGYRNRLRLRIEDTGQIAFFNQEKAWDCCVLEPSLAAVIGELRTFAALYPQNFAGFRHVELRARDADGFRAACFTRRPAACTGAAGAPFAATECLTAVNGVSEPMPRQRFWLTEDVFCYVPIDGFLQVNSAINQALVARLTALAVSRGLKSFADFYAGSGNLSLPLLCAGLRGAAVEASASGIGAASAAARVQGFGGIEWVTGSAPEVAARWAEEYRSFDLVIADPPRAGVHHGIESLAALARRYIALCSCNPDTLARDVAALDRLGFAVERLLLFDMFPHTRHVESLVWLRRKLLD